MEKLSPFVGLGFMHPACPRLAVKTLIFFIAASRGCYSITTQAPKLWSREEVFVRAT
jgi:hypothetical protein